MTSQVALLAGVLAACSCHDRGLPAQSTPGSPMTAHRITVVDGAVQIDPTPTPLAGEPEFVCSKCYKSVSRAHLHVIPWFNETASDYFTTYRCDDDWLSSLDETAAHMRGNLERAEDRGKLAAFFERHHLPADPSNAARFKVEAFAILGRIRDRRLTLEP